MGYVSHLTVLLFWKSYSCVLFNKLLRYYVKYDVFSLITMVVLPPYIIFNAIIGS